MTIYAEHVSTTRRARAEPRLPSQAAGEAARRARDRQLTMSERLERVHQLCAQMTSLAKIRQRRG